MTLTCVVVMLIKVILIQKVTCLSVLSHAALHSVLSHAALHSVLSHAALHSPILYQFHTS